MNYGRIEKDDDEFSLSYVELEVPVGHRSDSIYQAFGYMN